MIKSFTGKHRFLSNFYPSAMRIDGIVYPTVEHAFQAHKAADPVERVRISLAPTPGEAKRMGRRARLRDDWEGVKVAVMRGCLFWKFCVTLHPILCEKLLATEDEELVEGNTWGDTFWGVDARTMKGENWLGRLLMERRQELRGHT